MTWYRQLTPQQEPFDGGVDDKARAVVIFNVLAIKRPSATFVEELAALLVAEGVGGLGTSIFASTSVAIPGGAGPYLHLVETGGTGPLRSHNVAGPFEQRPTAKISVHAATHLAAKTMARAAYDALASVENTDLAP